MRLSVEVLHDAFVALCGDDALELMEQHAEDFNASLLYFLPKKLSGTGPTGEGYYEPANVRPLNVTNTDNRLLANAVRLLIEPAVGPRVLEIQRGFIAGRSMLSNLVDIEEAAVRTACSPHGGGAIFFDFAAAFPSIEHSFLRAVFESLNWPCWLRTFIDVLYAGNFCDIVMDGARYDGFSIHRGIRQGCPLSPLLFAVAADLLLRRLARDFPAATLRAYADDTALVDPQLMDHLGQLERTFGEYARISGLDLNVGKTVLVPLGQLTHVQVRERLQQGSPLWGAMAIADSAKYLGFVVGPGRGEKSWDAPFASCWTGRPSGARSARACCTRSRRTKSSSRRLPRSSCSWTPSLATST